MNYIGSFVFLDQAGKHMCNFYFKKFLYVNNLWALWSLGGLDKGEFNFFQDIFTCI